MTRRGGETTTQAAESLPSVAPRSVVDRLQWRVWGDLAEVEERLHRLAPERRLQDSHDIYLLGTRPTHNVKVRERRLEVNLLLDEVDGFQRWTRAALQPLPCAAVRLHELLAEIADPAPAASVGTDRLGRRRLLELAAQCGLRPVTVRKQRQRFRLGKLRAEATVLDVQDSDLVLHCIAIEGRDLAALSQLRADLGVDRLPNLAVPAALERAGSLRPA
jgi:hypothetical protein